MKTLHSLALPLAALAALSLSLAGCPSAPEDPSKDAAAISLSATGRAYTAGYSSGIIRAYYWEDATLRTIADAGLGTATKAACVVPTNLGDYIVGARTDQVGDDYEERAVLWFNGSGAYLDDRPSFALSAILHDGKIMAAGWRESEDSSIRPCWWEVSDTWTMREGAYAVADRTIERHDLPSISGGQARDIAASGSEVYVCGNYFDGSSYRACLWTNDERTDLAGGVKAEALCVWGGSIYVGGASVSGARYWIDGAAHDLSGLPAGASDSIVTAVAVGAPGLVLGGTYYRNDYLGFRSVSGVMTTALPCVIGAAALGSEVYVGCEEGWFENDSYTELPWIEGRRPRGIKMRVY